MTVSETQLKTAYEIGSYIAEQVPFRDEKQPTDSQPWAEHADFFTQGPSPFSLQLESGVMLKVVNLTSMPTSIFSRHGEWKIFGSAIGNFEAVFHTLQKTLQLEKVKELSNKNYSFWAVREWQGQKIPSPVIARPTSDTYLSFKQVRSAYIKFQEKISLVQESNPTHFQSKL